MAFSVTKKVIKIEARLTVIIKNPGSLTYSATIVAKAYEGLAIELVIAKTAPLTSTGKSLEL